MTTAPDETPDDPVVGWLDLDELVQDWADAPPDSRLRQLAAAAFDQCAAYAPRLVAGAPVPASYREAQRLQLMHLWARDKSGNGEGIGPDGYVVSTFPLVLEARSLMRPKRGPLAGLL